jgi:hypothetical protein
MIPRLLYVTRGMALRRDPEAPGVIYHIAPGRM